MIPHHDIIAIGALCERSAVRKGQVVVCAARLAAGTGMDQPLAAHIAV